MNKNLIKSISKKSGVTQSDVKKIIDLFLSDIKEKFEKGEMVQLRGFGTFYSYYKTSRSFTTARTKEKRVMKGRRTLKFKPSQQILLYE